MKILIGSETSIGTHLLKVRKFDQAVKSSGPFNFDLDPTIEELTIVLPSDILSTTTIEQALIQSHPKKVIFISSLDVYRNPVGVTESDKPLTSYNASKQVRIDFERFILSHCQDSLILRLPVVFGAGQSVDFLYNLMQETNLHDVNLNSSIQWYNIENLNNDLAFFSTSGYDVVNMAVEPIESKTIINKFFPDKLKKCAIKDREEQDSWSIYPGKMLNTIKYFYDRHQILRDLEKFIKG